MNHAHLTPEKLLSTLPFPKAWAEAKTAFICYTPYPQGFNPYVQVISKSRYFVHSPISEVRLCRYQNIPFIVISEVYGFPVGATTVEELIYRGIDTIIGIGYAGAFHDAPMGKQFVAMETISDLPLARHYGVEAMVPVGPSKKVLKKLIDNIGKDIDAWGKYRLWNSNSLYREYPTLVRAMKEKGCDAVNMDVLSLYAVAALSAQELDRNIEYIYVGTVTDAEKPANEEWQSDLADVVCGRGKNPHDDLVRFMVENLIPRRAE